jgi:hypothetical protein
MNRDRMEDNWKQFEGKQKYRLEYSSGDENPFASKHEQTSSNIQEVRLHGEDLNQHPRD